MEDHCELFFSYRRQDFEKARPFLDALTELGIRVWRDQSGIPDHSSISRQIREAIANAKAFMAFYSASYPLSKACQQEITAAWIAAEQLGENPNCRVWLVNPEQSFEHLAQLFRDQQIPLAGPGMDLKQVASSIQTGLKELSGTLGGDAEQPPKYYGMSPVQAKRFVGRAREFWDLHGKLNASRIGIITGTSGSSPTQVRGLGGNGKSLFSREYSVRFGSAYKGGIFWLNAFGYDNSPNPLTPDQREILRQDQIRSFATDLGIEITGLASEQLESRFWRELGERGQKFLWIVDDLPHGLRATELERFWHSKTPIGATLITSRSREYGAQGETLDLDVLSEPEAIELLTSHRTPKSLGEQSAALEIVTLLGRHPLAVEIAGSYLNLELEGFESYSTALQNPTEDALELGTVLGELLPLGHERSIVSTLLRSIRQLGVEGLEFLRLTSVLAAAPVPTSLISEILSTLHPGSQQNWAIRGIDQADILSLCERVTGGARSVHTLVHRSIHFGAPDRDSEQRCRNAAIVVLGRRHSDIELTRQSPEMVANELPHVRHLLAGGENTLEEVTLALWLARYDYDRGDYAAAVVRQKNALYVLSTALGEEHQGTLTATNNLALTLFSQGDLNQAYALQERVLKARLCALGEDHQVTLTAQSNLAGTLREQGRLADALHLHERVFVKRQALLGATHYETLIAKNNLAGTLYDLGNYERAVALFREVVNGHQGSVGAEHPDTLGAINNLSRALINQGHLLEAEQLQRPISENASRVLGSEHPIALEANATFALVLSEKREIEKASELQRRVLASRERILGSRHPYSISAKSEMALTLCKKGEFAGALALQEEILTTVRESLGEDHQKTLTILNDLAETLAAMGRLKEAHAIHIDLLERSSRVLGHEHPDTLRSLNNLAGNLHEQGLNEKAETIQEQVVDASKRVLGERHPRTLISMRNLGSMMYKRQRFRAARKLQKELLSIRIEMSGEDDIDSVIDANKLAWTLTSLGDFQQAREIQEKALASGRKVFGEAHPETLIMINNLAGTLTRMGDVSGARKVLEEGLRISHLGVGEEHPTALTLLHNLACSLWSLNNRTEALKIEKRVLSGRKRVLGKHDQDTLDVGCDLANMLYIQGDRVGAHELITQTIKACLIALGERHAVTVRALASLKNIQNG